MMPLSLHIMRKMRKKSRNGAMELSTLQNKEKMLYFILNNSQECVIRYDKNGCISFCNDRLLQLTGYTNEELTGVYIGEIMPGSFEITDGLVGLSHTFKPDDVIETTIYRKNQTCFPVEIKILTLREEGDPVYICTAVDMTRYKESIKRVEETTIELQKSMKTRDAFVANVTHELRTPVNGIKGHAEILLEDEHDSKKVSCLKMILDCCGTMEGIINNILDFSKLEAGKFQIEHKPFSFYDFISSSEKMFTLLTQKKGLRFMLNVSEDIPDRVIGDELRLKQILNNLVSNAVKFTEKGYIGVEVNLNMRLDDEIELYFMVVDTGIGFSTEERDKLFKSFSQVDASITRKYGGTGLGLSITKDLVSMMNGKIWAEGEKGKGSNFSFTVRLKLEKEDDNESIKIMEQLPKRRWNTSPQINDITGEQYLRYEFGSDLNRREIRNYFEKLNISMDMDNWMKAESFAGILKKLMAGGSKELNRAVFRMEMSIRKSDYEKSIELADEVKRMVIDEIGARS